MNSMRQQLHPIGRHTGSASCFRHVKIQTGTRAPIQRPALGRRQSRYDRFVRGRGPLASADPGKAKLPDSDAEYAAGDRVFHQKFGYGRVVAVDGNKLDIAFEKAGTKKVIANFVEPA